MNRSGDFPDAQAGLAEAGPLSICGFWHNTNQDSPAIAMVALTWDQDQGLMIRVWGASQEGFSSACGFLQKPAIHRRNPV